MIYRKRITVFRPLVLLLSLLGLVLPTNAQISHRVSVIEASDKHDNDHFGAAVDLDGDLAVVGAWGNGSGGQFAGAAYVLAPDVGGDWAEVQRLVPSDASADAFFGSSVALKGDRMIVGAFDEDSEGDGAGAAYIFERDATGFWLEVAKLTASDASAGSAFGWEVAIDGDAAVVGAIYDRAQGTNAGAAYVFERDASGSWTETAKLLPSEVNQNDFLGKSVAIDGDVILVSAFQQTYNTGAVYAFERDGMGSWVQTAKLLPKPGVGRFGFWVDLDGDTALISAPGQIAAGGAAFIYERDATGTWTEVAALASGDSPETLRFGFVNAIEGNLAVVGAQNVLAPSVPAGAAFVFQKDPAGGWSLLDRLEEGSMGNPDMHVNYFGAFVALSGEAILVADAGATNSYGVTLPGCVLVFNPAGTGIEVNDGPGHFILSQNYPNPFNPATTIVFELPDAVYVSLSAYDMMGRQVRVLANGVMTEGRNEVTFDAGDLPSGMYVYRLTTPTRTLSKSMVLIK